MVLLVHSIDTIMKSSIDNELQPAIVTNPKSDEHLDGVEKMTEPTICNELSTAVQYDNVTIGKNVAINPMFIVVGMFINF